MASVLDWAYWHLERSGSRQVLGGATPLLDYISPGQLPPGDPDRQVAMSVLRGSSFEPWDGDPLAGWHRVTLGFDARAESNQTAQPASMTPPAMSFGGDFELGMGGDRVMKFGAMQHGAESPDAWCQEVLTAIRNNLLAFSVSGVPVTNQGISVVSVGCSYEVSWYGRDDSGRELYHLEMPVVYSDA